MRQQQHDDAGFVYVMRGSPRGFHQALMSVENQINLSVVGFLVLHAQVAINIGLSRYLVVTGN